ncbi:MAG: hypothetical protein Q9195_005805 [Heterodermia aff. obscurata]
MHLPPLYLPTSLLATLLHPLTVYPSPLTPQLQIPPSSNTTYHLAKPSLTPIPITGPSSPTLNCHGSPIGCLGAATDHTMRVLHNFMRPLTSAAHYYPGQNIACVQHRIFGLPVVGYYCAFLEGGGVPAGGVNGVELVRLMETLIRAGCAGCGMVEIADGVGGKEGWLKVDYVSKSACTGLCIYSANGGLALEWRPGDDGVVLED